MRTTSYRSVSILSIILLFSVFISFSSIKAANIVSSLDFQISPSAQTAGLGDYILMNMAVIDATDTYSNVSVVSVTDTTVVVYSPDFPLGWPGVIYVYDGSRTWRVDTTYSPLPQQLTLSNTNLYAGQPIASYLTMQYADFNAAVGIMASGGSATVDIGTAISGIPLYDDGIVATHNDAGFNDGIYNCKFLVRESYKFNIQNGSITGKFVKSGLQASNTPFMAPSKINIDGIRPKISLVNANPNPFNPNRELEQFYYSLSEVSTVSLTILQGAVTVKTLTASGNFGYNQPILWDGLDDNGAIQTDGDYTYRFDLMDAVGNTGTTFNGVLKITTVELTTSLYSIDSQYIHTSQPQVMVTIQMHAELANATTANLQNLGFNYAEAGITHDYHNYPYVYLDLRLYDSGGNLTDPAIKDSSGGADTDLWYINMSDTYFNPTFADGWAMTGFVYDPPPFDGCSIIPGHLYNKPDENEGNDWDNVFLRPFTDLGGGYFTSDPVYVYYSDSITPGTYIAAFRGVLVGKSIVLVNPEPVEGSADCVVGTDTVAVEYIYDQYHAMPSYFVDSSVGYIGDERGYGLTSEDNTVSFIVDPITTVPVPDTTVPYILALTEDPTNGKIVAPGEISPTNYIQIDIRDDGVGAGPINLSTIVLLDPNGNPVPGHIAWNGGIPGTTTWSVYYIPDAPITIGGEYEYTVTPRDGANNQGTPATFNFSVTDTAIPVVQNVRVQAGSGTTLDLSASIATQVTFLVSKIEATINPGGTSPVNWTASSISVSGVAGVSSHTAGSSTLEFTPSGVMADGQYTVSITSVSDNGATGISTYVFYITTAAVTYVNLGGGNLDNSNTCLRISSFTTTQSGVSDGTPVDIHPTSLTAISVAVVASPPGPPAGYNIIGSTIAFSVTSAYSMPLNFNPTLCASNLRMHFSDANLSTLIASGLTSADLTLWVYDSSWIRITTAGNIINNGTDHYLEVPISTIPAGNRYALMYQPPVIPPIVHKFENDKAFNPANGPAKVYYTDTIADITSMKVYIYNISGTLVRTLDFNDSAENALFTSSDTDPANPLNFKYYISWDGRNDKGSLVRNGIYIFKYKITRTTGPAVSKTRMIAVVK